MSARSVSAKVRRQRERKQKTELLAEMRQWIPDPLDVAALRELLQESLRGFAVEAGMRVALCLLQDEVLQLCGPAYQRQPGREFSRYGRQPGVVLLAGRGVPILKPRVRYKDGRGEKTLGTYEQLQRPEAISESTLAKMVRGVSCRNYEEVLDTARASLGVQKSNVSRGLDKLNNASVESKATRTFQNSSKPLTPSSRNHPVTQQPNPEPNRSPIPSSHLFTNPPTFQLRLGQPRLNQRGASVLLSEACH